MMLYEQANNANLAEYFASAQLPTLFPAYNDRQAWAALPAELTQPWLDIANEYIAYDWPALTMSNWLRIKRSGETFSGWQAFTKRRSLLGVFLIAECIEGKSRFTEQIINGIITICEETSWVQMLNIRSKDFALPDESDNYVDLCAAETAQLFAWITALFGAELDKEDAGIRRRMEWEIMRRVIRPYLDRDDYWWMGFTQDRINNWNPWCNQNVLEAVMLMRIDPALQAQVVEKVCRSLDVYIDRYPEDGACDEGPGYWSAAGLGLGTCVDLLKRMTGGMVDGSRIEKLYAIASYIYKVHIDGDWFVDYADGDARLGIGPGVFRLGEMLGDEKLIDMGRLFKPSPPVLTHWFSIYANLMALFDASQRDSKPARPAYLQCAVFENCEVLCAREREGDPTGFFLSAKGGNNVESHNHNDVGNFVVFLDSQPLFIDLGTEEYSLKTFSKDRFSIWYLQSQYHNCPTIAGRLQQDGKEFYAEDARFDLTNEYDKISMELRHAYPSDTPVRSWRRSVALVRASGTDQAFIEIDDEYEGLGEGVTSYNFVTRARPELDGESLLLDAGNGVTARLSYNSVELDVRIEEIPITESRMLRNWGGMIWRIVFTEKVHVADAERAFIIEKVVKD
ncbi:heparinase [Clostridia bacterium]|nr:heparinase [Clostridia bacterium]